MTGRLVICSRAVALLLIPVLGFFAGCVSKAAAKAQAQAAYAAGQQEALARMQQARGPSITINGLVNTPVLPWSPDLTLARALVVAEYHGPAEPSDILIIRAGRAIRIDPKELLNGQDVPLQPGDLVEIRQWPGPVKPQ